MDGFTAVKTRHHYVMSGGQVSKGETVLGCREAREVHLTHKNQTFSLTVFRVSVSAGLHMPITVVFFQELDLGPYNFLKPPRTD